jgi:thiamine biosynthesis protein ThiS
MKIIVNGKDRETGAANVEQLVSELGLPSAAVLVEHNGTALLRSEWSVTELRGLDRLEIIRMVAGG